MLFDAYVVVDWSAASKPKQGVDSVWIAVGEWDATTLRRDPSRNPRTRAEAVTVVQERLRVLVGQDKRVLVGFDFPYGYPQGFAAALRSIAPAEGDQGDWASVWRYLRASLCDNPNNANNRFEAAATLNAGLTSDAAPFWGCPAGKGEPSLRPTSPSFPVIATSQTRLERYRHTEARLRRRGSQVQETWKLFGIGSVGSQALLGIPRVAALRWSSELDEVSAIWPFETGFTRQPGRGQRPLVLHAEIWPGLAPWPRQEEDVKDKLQVEGLVAFLAEKDAAGGLEALFDAPEGLDDGAIEACTREEGWILGA